MLPLQILLLLLCLLHRLEEAFQPRLLRCLQVPVELGGGIADSVFAETFLCDQELDQAVDVGGFPFEFAVWVICGADIGFEEEGASVLVGPVFGDGVLLLRVFLDEGDDFFEGFVFADEV